jgi:putative MATE family efflux protein
LVSLAATQMLSVGCVALVSQAAGRKDHAEVQRLFNQAQCLATLGGILFLVVCLVFRGAYVERLAGDAATAELASSFLAWFLPALALQFTVMGLASSLRGIGDMKPGLVAQTAGVMFNMALAPFLVFGWITGKPLGVAGAAIASLVATVLTVFGLALYLRRRNTFLRLRLADWKPDFPTWRAMLGIGLPSGAEFLLLSISTAVVYVVTRRFGVAVQAGFGIGSRVMQAGLMPAVATSFAVAAVVGQNFGARSFHRVREARRESTKLALGFALAFMLLCKVAARPMIGVFASEPEVIAAGVDYLDTVSWVFAAGAVTLASAGVLQGIGYTWPSLAASTLRAIAFVVPVLVLGRSADFTPRHIWLVTIGTAIFQVVVQQLLLQRELGRRAPLGGGAR